MIVKYDEDNFSIKLYRDFVKGKLVGLMEVIPIEDLLDVWEKHKAEQTDPQKKCITCEHRYAGHIEVCDACDPYIKDEPQTDYKKWDAPPKVDLPTGEITTCVSVLAAAFEEASAAAESYRQAKAKIEPQTEE